MKLLHLLRGVDFEKIDQECPLISLDDLSRIDKRILATKELDQSNYQKWKLYKKATILIFNNFIKGIFHEDEVFAWVVLDAITRSGFPENLKKELFALSLPHPDLSG